MPSTSSSDRLDPDCLNFLRRAHRMLDGTAASAADADDAGGREAEMRAEVVRTVVEQLRGSEIACARHVFGSVALARVLSAATNAQRTSLAAPILERGQPLTLLSDKYASHVVEAVLAIAAAEGADAAGGGVAGLIAPFVDRLCEPDAACMKSFLVMQRYLTLI